jgi:probable biosynthetic protein (TIGR04098 family)
VPLPLREPGPIPYPLVPESDLNGAGLLYFARYAAIFNYAERVLLTQRAELPLSRDLVAGLATVHRKLFYFGNAEAHDTLLVRPGTPRLRLTPSSDAREDPRTGMAELATLWLDQEMFRASDGVLLAASSVQKSLVVPRRSKALKAEVQRLERRLADLPAQPSRGRSNG